MNFDRRLIHLISGVKGSLIASIASGILAAVFIIGQAGALSKIIDGAFLQNKPLDSLWLLLGLFALFSLGRAFFVWNEQNKANKLASHIKNDLRHRIHRQLQKLGPVYLKGERSGEISNTLLNGVESLDAYFSQFLPQLLLLLSTLIPLSILLFVFPIDFLSGLVLLLTAPLIPFFMTLIGSLAEKLNRQQWKALSRMSAHFLDVLQGLTTLKLFGRSKEQIKTIFRISDNFRHTTMKVLKIAFLSALVMELVASISIAILAVEIGLRLLHGNFNFEQAFFILVLAPEFYLPIRLLGTRYHAGMEGMAAAQRIFEILETPAPEVASDEKLKIDITSSPMRFINVEYAYGNGDRPALRNINFAIQPGEKVALVGPSGAGKSTINSLLLRFIQPTSGKIFINESDLNEVDPDAWREHIAWVPQHPYLFHQSIADNIRLAKSDATDSQVAEAARRANIHNFIESLPEEYDTLVGERGARLSGGQAQRIALARAFLKDAPFLILDEPTANLDPQVEALIQQSLQQLMKNRTVLITAHRLNTVFQADLIVVLSQGTIAQMGTHENLMAEDGLYRQLIHAYGGTS